MNLSRGAFRNLAAALGLAVLASAANADWTLITADATSSNGQPNLTINTWTAAEGLSATDRSGKLVRFPTRDIVSLSSGRKVSTEPHTDRWRLTLRNGDVLYGLPEKFSGKSLVFRVPEIGQVAIPLKNVANLVNPKPDLQEAMPVVLSATDKDVVYLGNKDHADGILVNVDTNKLQLQREGADTPTDISLENVAAVAFGGAAAPRGIPPLSVRFNFVSGTAYTVPLDSAAQSFNWSISKITLKDAAGEEHAISGDALATVEVLGGRVVYLTELDPASQEQVSLLGTKWPMQINHNALGQPLRVAREDYSRGIGVHAKSTLTYALDGSFETLSLRVGLDDSAAPYGEAIAEILLDGKSLWKSNILKPGEISPELNLPIAGGKRLELVASPAARLDVLARVDWLNVALKRK
jgi:hypothetical protein